MSKELMLFYNADGKWAVYDDTFDITIHCESQKEQDEAMAMLCKANSSAGEVMSPENMAHSLMALCKAHSDAGNGCPGCPFDKPTSNNGDGVNPTPVSEEEAFSNLVEELADINLCSIVLFGGELDDDDPCNMCDAVGDRMVEIMEQKLARWKYRLMKKEAPNVPEE